MSKQQAEADRPEQQQESDQTPGALPWLGSVIRDVQAVLHANGYLGIILLDLKPLADIEAECGRTVYNGVILRICEQVVELRHTIVRSDDLICSVQPFGEEIVLFLGAPRSAKKLTTETLEKVTDRIWSTLAPKIAELVRPYGGQGRFQLGYSLTLPNPMIQTERLIYRAIEQAREIAEDYSHRVDARGRETLKDLIITRQLSAVFQPITEMPSARIRAYEGLVRGPPGTDLVSPAMLFNLAGRANLIAELDRACCDSAVDGAVGLPEGTLLFINVLPMLINDPDFRSRIIQLPHLTPPRIVLEVNEGVAVRSYDVLVKGIAELRSNGIRFAVDNLGTGHTNLDQVHQLEPNFLKLDISLIRDVHHSPVKQALIKSVVAMSSALGATVIAEGVELSEERDSLISLGVAWGQGNFFGKPQTGFSALLTPGRPNNPF